MPVEFSVAAYRFGHSMIRPSYGINEVITPRNPLTRLPVFSAGPTETNMNGFGPLPPQWGIDWTFFYEVDEAQKPQRSYKIDATLSHPLSDLLRPPP